MTPTLICTEEFSLGKRMKMDLVMWTLNGERTLQACLSSLEKSIPDSHVCHRIMVDGGSVDDTRSIAEDFDWDFLPCKRGIGEQANYALSRVDTSLYASFEQDILLSPVWLPRMEKIISKERVAVAQGLRLSRGSRPVQVVERWMFEHDPSLRSTVSIDNNLNRSDMIREIGGYPIFDPVQGIWPDSLMWNRIFARGYRWIIDPDCISGHLRPSYWGYVKHFMFLGLSRRIAPRGRRSQRYARLILSPIRAAQIARKYHAPSALPAYPIFRYAVAFCQLMQREPNAEQQPSGYPTL